ncbi:MAG: hypothetical protein H2056_00325 [Sphingopyxis sp.]|nr:hypothetical protein [Sphingopyxis sp.]
MLCRPISFLTPLAALLLAACASGASGDYPSLGKRPIEERFAVVESVPLAPPGLLPADLAGRLARWRSDADGAAAAFTALRGETEAAVTAARGAAPGSEAWVVAQQALSRLTVARGPLMVALGDIDALYVARQDGDAIDGLPEIVALRDELAARLGEQDMILTALAAQMAE